MSLTCPSCRAGSHAIVRDGHFFRRADSRHVPRLRCTRCGRSFNRGTTTVRHRLRHRRLLPLIQPLMCSGLSLRRLALLLGISRNTLVRYVAIAAAEARERQARQLLQRIAGNVPFDAIQFDDLHTFEHTKLKPLSVCVVIERDTRFIIGHSVARIPASGLLAAKARKKYGPRDDESIAVRQRLFETLAPCIAPDASFVTDKHTDYRPLVRRLFPNATHTTYKREESCVTGQGELKKTVFDELFSINHTLAMLRANINRLVRRTWCTTKLPERLDDHIALYCDYHNRVLLNGGESVSLAAIRDL